MSTVPPMARCSSCGALTAYPMPRANLGAECPTCAHAEGALVLDVARAFRCEECDLSFRSARLVPDCPRCGSWSHVCQDLEVAW